MFGNNHWIIGPNLVRSIQIDPLTMTASLYLLLLKPQMFHIGVDTEAVSHQAITTSTPH